MNSTICKITMLAIFCILFCEISHINSFPVTLSVDVMCLWSENKIVMYDLSITPPNNTVSYCTLLPCYIALLAWHPTRSLGQKLQRVNKQCYRDTYCYAYFICAYPCQMSRLACRVIAHMPVLSPFYLFSHGGSHIYWKASQIANGVKRFSCSTK